MKNAKEPPLNVTADIEPKAWQDQLFDALKRATSARSATCPTPAFRG